MHVTEAGIICQEAITYPAGERPGSPFGFVYAELSEALRVNFSIPSVTYLAGERPGSRILRPILLL